jgi:hypothetical protein
MATGFAPTILACGGIFLLSFFMIWAFWFVGRLRGARPPSWESKAKLHYEPADVIGLHHLRLRHKKSRDFLRGLLSTPFFVNFLSSGSNSYAHAGRAEADTATFFKTPALDMRPARSVSVNRFAHG